MKNNFKVGDRIVSIKKDTYASPGTKGTVKEITDSKEKAAIEWDINVGGWEDEDLNIELGHGEYVRNENIRHIEEIKVETKGEIKTMSNIIRIKDFKVGKTYKRTDSKIGNYRILENGILQFDDTCNDWDNSVLSYNNLIKATFEEVVELVEFFEALEFINNNIRMYPVDLMGLEKCELDAHYESQSSYGMLDGLWLWLEDEVPTDLQVAMLKGKWTK